MPWFLTKRVKNVSKEKNAIAFKKFQPLKLCKLSLTKTFLLSFSTGLFLCFFSQQKQLVYPCLASFCVFVYYADRIKILPKTVVGLLLLIGSALFSVTGILSVYSLIHLALAALAAFFYTRQDKFSMREVPHLKAYYIALVWSLVGLGAKPLSFPFAYLIHALSLFVFFFILAVASDVKDREADPKRLKTFPQVYPWNILRASFVALMAVDCIAVCFWAPSLTGGMTFAGLFISVKCLRHTKPPTSVDLDLALLCFAVGMGIQNNSAPFVLTFLSLPH